MLASCLSTDGLTTDPSVRYASKKQRENYKLISSILSLYAQLSLKKGYHKNPSNTHFNALHTTLCHQN